MRRGGADKGAHGFEDRAFGRRSVLAIAGIHHGLQPVFAELLTAFIHGFGDAIGVEDEGVARFQVDLLKAESALEK